MEPVKSYQDLVVWQRAMEAATIVYALTKEFPREETYGLTSQIRRAAVSISCNIAEGHARNSTAEFVHFLSIAQGSRAEVETQLLLAVRLQYLTQESAAPALSHLSEISRMLSTIIRRLRSP